MAKSVVGLRVFFLVAEPRPNDSETLARYFYIVQLSDGGLGDNTQVKC